MLLLLLFLTLWSVQKSSPAPNSSFLYPESSRLILSDSSHKVVRDTTDTNAYYQVMDLEGVTVIDCAMELRKEESSNVTFIRADFIRQNRGGSLMKSLERLPGISAIGIGSGSSKPLIRGLGFNQVMVVENGIKHEGQQWGADH